MGIRGLSHYVQACGECVILHTDDTEGKDRSIIIVDGSQILFWLCKDLPFVDIELASYSLLKEKIMEFIYAFRLNGFDLHFYFDGKKTYSSLEDEKSDTMMNRYSQQIQNILELCPVNDVPSYPKSGGAKPRLGNWLFHSLLKEMDCMSLYCTGEADPYISLNSINNNNVFGILSNDSDFMFVIGTKTILLDSVKIDKNSDGFSISANIFLPEDIAKFLKIDSSLFYLFSSLAGNDFTKPELSENPKIYSEIGIKKPSTLNLYSLYQSISSL